MVRGEGEGEDVRWNERKCGNGEIAGILSTKLTTFGSSQKNSDVVGLYAERKTSAAQAWGRHPDGNWPELLFI